MSSDPTSPLELRERISRRVRILGIPALAIGLLVGGGCVRRVVEITSEPAGAIVWMNDREVGSTPCEVEILHYGEYDLRVVKPGYEPLVAGRKANAPVWDLPGPDLVAEILPFELSSRNAWHLTLVVEDMSTDSVIERAIVARDRLEALDTVSPADSSAATSQGLAEEVERADGRAVEPGEPMAGPIEAVAPEEPGVDGANLGQDPDIPADSPSAD